MRLSRRYSSPPHIHRVQRINHRVPDLYGVRLRWPADRPMRECPSRRVEEIESLSAPKKKGEIRHTSYQQSVIHSLELLENLTAWARANRHRERESESVCHSRNSTRRPLRSRLADSSTSHAIFHHPRAPSRSTGSTTSAASPAKRHGTGPDLAQSGRRTRGASYTAVHYRCCTTSHQAPRRSRRWVTGNYVVAPSECLSATRLKR